MACLWAKEPALSGGTGGGKRGGWKASRKQKKNHQVYNAESTRVRMTAYDDKRYILGPEVVQT